MSPLSEVLFSSELWKVALEKYAEATHLTVKLFDTEFRTVLGPIQPTPLFQLFDEQGFDPGIFAECAQRCLMQTVNRPVVVVSQAHGLAVIGTSLALEGKVVGAAVAGYALLDFSQVSDIERLARQAVMKFERVWHVARQQKPVPQRRLIVHGELLQVLGDALLRENLRTRKSEKLTAELEHIVDQRTTALRRLSSSLLHVQDDQSRRISRELHDSLGQYLSHAKMSLSALARTNASEKEAEALSLIGGDLEECLNEMRTISYLLHPPLLEELGFTAAAAWFVQGFSKRSGIPVKLEIPHTMKRLPEALELVLFRILQESLTNVHRYAQSRSVDVEVNWDAEEVTLQVRDHGKGISPELLERFKATGEGAGIGLSSMRERIKELDGRFEIESSARGTIIRAVIPVVDSAGAIDASAATHSSRP